MCGPGAGTSDNRGYRDIRPLRGLGDPFYSRRAMRKRDVDHSSDVADDEVLADLSADEAAQADCLGERRKAEILRDLARRHRVQAMKDKALRGARRRR